jgi:DNA-binding response OmpR family regulator
MRQLLKRILSEFELDISEASSSQYDPGSCGRLPSLAVVDVDPSFENGMVVWHSLRRNPLITYLPSVFLVEAGDEVIYRLAGQAGASTCLEKPFHPRDLRTIVDALLSRALDLTQPRPGAPDRPW